jgi:hypothetical protein
MWFWDTIRHHTGLFPLRAGWHATTWRPTLWRLTPRSPLLQKSWKGFVSLAIDWMLTHDLTRNGLRRPEGTNPSNIACSFLVRSSESCRVKFLFDFGETIPHILGWFHCIIWFVGEGTIAMEILRDMRIASMRSDATAAAWSLASRVTPAARNQGHRGTDMKEDLLDPTDKNQNRLNPSQKQISHRFVIVLRSMKWKDRLLRVTVCWIIVMVSFLFTFYLGRETSIRGCWLLKAMNCRIAADWTVVENEPWIAV